MISNWPIRTTDQDNHLSNQHFHSQRLFTFPKSKEINQSQALKNQQELVGAIVFKEKNQEKVLMLKEKRRLIFQKQLATHLKSIIKTLIRKYPRLKALLAQRQLDSKSRNLLRVR